MLNKTLVKCTIVPFSLALLLVGCRPSTPTGSPLEALVGDWQRDGARDILRFNADGTYVIDNTGQLETKPADSGVVTFDGKTLTFTSGEGSRHCNVGDLWVWEIESVGDEQFTGVVTEDTCTNYEGKEWTWTRCVAEPQGEAGLFVCKPVD